MKFPGESAFADTEATEMFPEDLEKVIIEGGFYKASDLAKEVGIVETDENDVVEVLASCDQDLTEELMQLQEPKIQMETK